MDLMQNMVMLGQVILALFLGAVIGWERERHEKHAGIRTFAAITVGACVFGLVSIHAIGNFDTTRVAAQVATGIGFLGAGVIFRQGNEVTGLTTAATLWVAAAVGLAIAFGLYMVAILTTLIVLLFLLLPLLPGWEKISPKKARKNGSHS